MTSKRDRKFTELKNTRKNALTIEIASLKKTIDYNNGAHERLRHGKLFKGDILARKLEEYKGKADAAQAQLELDENELDRLKHGELDDDFWMEADRIQEEVEQLAQERRDHRTTIIKQRELKNIQEEKEKEARKKQREEDAKRYRGKGGRGRGRGRGGRGGGGRGRGGFKKKRGGKKPVRGRGSGPNAKGGKDNVRI
jgi:hypothetical protein